MVILINSLRFVARSRTRLASCSAAHSAVPEAELCFEREIREEDGESVVGQNGADLGVVPHVLADVEGDDRATNAKLVSAIQNSPWRLENKMSQLAHSNVNTAI